MLSIILHVAMAIALAFVHSFAAFVTLRFFAGMANLGIFIVAYVLGKDYNDVATAAADDDVDVGDGDIDLRLANLGIFFVA